VGDQPKDALAVIEEACAASLSWEAKQGPRACLTTPEAKRFSDAMIALFALLSAPPCAACSGRDDLVQAALERAAKAEAQRDNAYAETKREVAAQFRLRQSVEADRDALRAVTDALGRAYLNAEGSDEEDAALLDAERAYNALPAHLRQSMAERVDARPPVR
jgi:hypothetical protein